MHGLAASAEELPPHKCVGCHNKCAAPWKCCDGHALACGVCAREDGKAPETRPAPVAPRACGECRGCAGDPIGDIPGSSDGWRVACIGDTGMGAGMLHEDPRAAPTGMLHEDPQGPADPMGMESELPTKSGNAAAARHGAMLPTPLHALRICGVWEADACVAGGAYDTPRHGGTEIVAGAQAMTVPPASLLLWGSLFSSAWTKAEMDACVS